MTDPPDDTRHNASPSFRPIQTFATVNVPSIQIGFPEARQYAEFVWQQLRRASDDVRTAFQADDVTALARYDRVIFFALVCHSLCDYVKNPPRTQELKVWEDLINSFKHAGRDRGKRYVRIDSVTTGATSVTMLLVAQDPATHRGTSYDVQELVDGAMRAWRGYFAKP